MNFWPKIRQSLWWLAPLALGTVLLYTTWPRQQWNLLRARLLNAQAVDRMGMGGYFVFDLVDTTGQWWQNRRLDSIDPEPFRTYLREHAAAVRNPVETNPVRRKHVVYLQLESMDGLVLGGRHGGEPLMPFLDELAEHNVAFINCIDNTATGRTTDGEFLVLTGQSPLPRPPVYVSQDLSKIPSLPRLLKAEGYHSVSIHGFNGAFWHREQAHTALGYDEMLFKDDLDLDEEIGWGWSDEQMLLFAADRLIAAERPLFLHAITLTNHHPYDAVALHQGIEPQGLEAEYVRSVRYVDEAIRSFFTKLEEAGVLDDCLIAIYGDHDSAIDVEMEAYLESFVPRLFPDTVPMVMVGFDQPPQSVEDIVGLQDVPVLVLEELGMEIPLTFLGNGWQKWGLTYGASHGGLLSKEGTPIVWEPPVSMDTLTLLSINHPEKLLAP